MPHGLHYLTATLPAAEPLADCCSAGSPALAGRRSDPGARHLIWVLLSIPWADLEQRTHSDASGPAQAGSPDHTRSAGPATAHGRQVCLALLRRRVELLEQRGPRPMLKELLAGAAVRHPQDPLTGRLPQKTRPPPGLPQPRARAGSPQTLLRGWLACGEGETKASSPAWLGSGLPPAQPVPHPRPPRPAWPHGRNFYSVDLRGLPTEPTGTLGRRSR